MKKICAEAAVYLMIIGVFVAIALLGNRAITVIAEKLPVGGGFLFTLRLKLLQLHILVFALLLYIGKHFFKGFKSVHFTPFLQAGRSNAL